MGCDIHGVVEKKVGDKWVMVNRLQAGDRNYARFASLAGVRGDGPEAKGLPEDLSESGQLAVDEWDLDGHNYSWLELSEAAKIFLATHYNPTHMMRSFPEYEFFGIEREDNDGSEYRLVFWFDN